MNYRDKQRVEDIVNLWLIYTIKVDIIESVALEGTGLSQSLELLGKKKRLMALEKKLVRSRKNVDLIKAKQTRNTVYRDGMIDKMTKIEKIKIFADEIQANNIIYAIPAHLRGFVVLWPQLRAQRKDAEQNYHTREDIALMMNCRLEVYTENRENCCRFVIELDKRLNPELYINCA